MREFLLVCAGGAVGTGARYLLTAWALAALGPSFPWGTFAVNTIGSFLLAFVMYLGVESSTISPTVRLALGTGVLGGFTTYSTFSFETMRYLQVGSWGLAITNVLASVIVCLAACMAGWAAARSMFGAP
ncbi:MAG: fluoride efflux transporter CrcB [Candidatus Binatia bacterium]